MCTEREREVTRLAQTQKHTGTKRHTKSHTQVNPVYFDSSTPTDLYKCITSRHIEDGYQGPLMSLRIHLKEYIDFVFQTSIL